ncbi:MAG: hypothetical protein AB7Q91_05305 [Phycisphaerales bacterium]
MRAPPGRPVRERRSLRASCLLAAAGGALLVSGCAPGARERCLSARGAVVSSSEGSREVAYFHVIEDFPRTSISQPATAITTASGEWMGVR